MLTPAQIASYAITPLSQVVNNITTYQMDITFLYPHYNGDRVIITLPN